MSLTFGGINLQRGVVLAPLAGVADRAFRQVCRSFGAELVVSEMISAKGICFGDKKTAELATITPEERPMLLQLFGSDPEYMAKAALRLLEFGPDGMDINMGCPVAKVAGNGDGAALMRSPDLAGRVVRAVAEALAPHGVPLSVKIRAGWDEASLNAVEIARIAEDNGAAMIAVHGRTREMMYSGRSDLDIIKAVKNAVKIPVIGNGDIYCAADGKKMFEYTGCDGIMVARGALGNPWIFREIADPKGFARPSPSEWYDAVASHIQLAVDYKGERRAIAELRKHIGWYIRGFPQAAVLRVRACEAETMEQMLSVAGEAAEMLQKQCQQQ